MHTILVDTNFILDLLARRESYYLEAQKLFTLADQGRAKLCVSSWTFANTHYVLSQQLKIKEVRQILRRFKVLVQVLSLSDKIIELALDSDFRDFEDAIQYYSALECDADLIISRNKKDFKLAKIPVLTAKEYLKLLQ